MEQTEKVICKSCSHYVPWDDWSHDYCCHRSCYEATGYDPVTGKEILKRIQGYGEKNRNLDCPDFKKKWFLF